MEKSFEIRFPLEGEYESLKALWQTSFDDTKESLDSFFRKSVAPERVLVAFEEGKPVSALYMLESEILIKEKAYSSYYIYAVCTHPECRGRGLMKTLFEVLFRVAESRGIDYLFLVPEQEQLFRIYEGLCFKNGFSYSEKTLFKKDFNDIEKIKTEKITYEKYRDVIKRCNKTTPVAVLKGSTFASFFNSVSGEVKAVFVENEGYALFEEAEKGVVIYELFGNEDVLLKAVLQNTEGNEIVYRYPTSENPIPYGMYYKINDVPEIKNGFFGIPYAN